MQSITLKDSQGWSDVPRTYAEHCQHRENVFLKSECHKNEFLFSVLVVFSYSGWGMRLWLISNRYGQQSFD